MEKLISFLIQCNTWHTLEHKPHTAPLKHESGGGLHNASDSHLCTFPLAPPHAHSFSAHHHNTANSILFLTIRAHRFASLILIWTLSLSFSLSLILNSQTPVKSSNAIFLWIFFSRILFPFLAFSFQYSPFSSSIPKFSTSLQYVSLSSSIHPPYHKHNINHEITRDYLTFFLSSLSRSSIHQSFSSSIPKFLNVISVCFPNLQHPSAIP